MAQGSTYNFRFTGDLDKMARFIEEQEEEEPTVSSDAPSSDTEIYVMKSQIGHERTASERLADRVRRSGAPIFSILAPPKLRGFIFVETNSPEALRDNLRGLTHARGMVMNRGKGYGRSKEPDTFGTTSLEELKPHLTPPPAVSGIEEGNIVEVIAGPFKGEKARVQRIDQAKEEVTVELFEAMVPIPITVRGDHVRVLEKDVN
jgi:transcriptional antiterminator NusG